MPNWDEDSPQLRKNLEQVLNEISSEAKRRSLPKVDLARHWQTICMQSLTVPDRHYVGTFRGEPGLENIGVKIGPYYGVEPAKVAKELRDRKSTRLNSSHRSLSRMPSSA